MNLIAHRINTVEALRRLPSQYGVEVDLRDWENEIVLSHDPFERGENFEHYLQQYHHGTLILNIKSERIEPRVITLLEKYHISDYFFLDSSIPMMYLLSEQHNTNLAVRFSEIEPIELALAMKDRAQWVWVDSFAYFALQPAQYDLLKQNHFKLCLVSPDLQARSSEISAYKQLIETHHFVFDAVCAKEENLGLWQ